LVKKQCTADHLYQILLVLFHTTIIKTQVKQKMTMSIRTLVDYSDLYEHEPVGPLTPLNLDGEQYRSNLYLQLDDPTLPDNLSIWELHRLIDYPQTGSISVHLRAVLPDDLQWLINRTYFRSKVVHALDRTYQFRWENPSNRLISLVCDEVGAIQQGHSGLEDMINDENLKYLKMCIDIKCDNCVVHGFPCSNLAVYGFGNFNLDCLFKHPNFV